MTIQSSAISNTSCSRCWPLISCHFSLLYGLWSFTRFHTIFSVTPINDYFFHIICYKFLNSNITTISSISIYIPYNVIYIYKKLNNICKTLNSFTYKSLKQHTTLAPSSSWKLNSNKWLREGDHLVGFYSLIISFHSSLSSAFSTSTFLATMS